MSQTAEYQIWSSIIRRPRATTVWPGWRNSFETFFRDVGPRPSPEMFLNRINNDQGYFPDNVRWASKCEQGKTQRGNQDTETSCEPNLAAGDE
jgi:hypothetical protein